MEIQQKNKNIKNEVARGEENRITDIKQQQQQQSKEDLQSTKQQQHAAAATANSLPPSASSSPSHEFSFAISIHSSSTANPDETKTQQPPMAIDLTPADDIFFHGQLLPLHLLSNQPISPRSSTNSLDSFSLPIRELLADEDRTHNIDSCMCSNCGRTKGHSFSSYEYDTRRYYNQRSNNGDEFPTKERVKSKSFSMFGLPSRRKVEPKGERCENQSEKHKWKLRFDVSHFLKKYIRMFSKGRREDIQLRKQPYSFSGKLSPREGKRNLRGRRGEFSAPASMRTSPTNSGILMATSGTPPSSSDSTMEELQAAIQAAIAHCKNSIATAESSIVSKQCV